MALVMARAADKSAAEQRFATIKEIIDDLEETSEKAAEKSSALEKVLPLCRQSSLVTNKEQSQ